MGRRVTLRLCRFIDGVHLGTEQIPFVVGQQNADTGYRHSPSIFFLRTQPIECEVVYLYLDRIVLKRSWGREIKNVSILVAVGVDGSGDRRAPDNCL